MYINIHTHTHIHTYTHTHTWRRRERVNKQRAQTGVSVSLGNWGRYHRNGKEVQEDFLRSAMEGTRQATFT